MKWFSSDWHLSHEMTIEKSGRPFKDVEEMDNTILYNMFQNCTRGDDFYYLGDLSWDRKMVERTYEIAKSKKIRLHWILGNHDQRWRKQFRNAIKTYNKMNTMSEMMEIKLTDEKGNHYPTVLCHYPMLTWNKSHYNSFFLFGHHHKTTHKADEIKKFEENGKRLNVCCEFHDYKPLSELDVIQIMKTRPDNWDIIRKNNG